MLEKIYINNYKNFQNFELNIQELNSVLILGKNGVGKTRFLNQLNSVALNKLIHEIPHLSQQHYSCKERIINIISSEIQNISPNLIFQQHLEELTKLLIKTDSYNIIENKKFVYNESKISIFVESNFNNEIVELEQDNVKYYNSEGKEITKEEFKTLEKILNYTYPNKLATTIPTKTSVTKLKQVEQEKLDIGIEELIGKQRNLEDKIEDVIEFPKPQFLKLEEKNKLTGAQKGTLIHLCMQNLDEKVDYNLIKVKELINSLVEKQIITKIEADNINPFKILEFTKSEIWRELKTAKLIEREKPFYLNIPANTIYNEKIEETILVQGVIDLYYVNKNDELILVDYKTDYIEKNKKYELVNKYKKQLELYQEALEQSFNKKVSKKYIYSTCLGQAIEI